MNIIKHYKEELNYENVNPGRLSNDQFNGRTPLHYASKYGHIKVVKYLTARIEDKNLPDDNGMTPLHLAAYYGHLEIVKLIASFESDKNPKAGRFWYERTPLHDAAYRGHLNVVEYLAGLVPDVNIKLLFLYLAARCGT